MNNFDSLVIVTFPNRLTNCTHVSWSLGVTHWRTEVHYDE